VINGKNSLGKKKVPIIVREIRNNPPLPVNFAVEKNISYSQLSMFTQCPKKWSLQYRDGHKVSEQSIHMTFGTALHEVIQHYIDKIYEVSGAAADRIDLEELFEDTLRRCYAEDYKKNNNEHFSSPTELREFFEDGKEILKFIKKKRNLYFKKKGTYLVGCEVPIVVAPNLRLNRVKYMGYLDIVLYNETLDTFKIIDIKTSTKGWNKWAKKDESKQFQLILYKHFFSKQYNIPIEKIDIEFFIVRRKVYVDGDYPQKRVQQFYPASGKVKINKAKNNLNEFINKAFNLDGSYKDTIFPAKPSKWNCTFCPFKDNMELCNVVGKNL
jgi:CRISPR/Cas system-associated exonuclease Cas4 (RecB family)